MNVRKGSPSVSFFFIFYLGTIVDWALLSKKRNHKSVCKICYNSLSSSSPVFVLKKKRCLGIPLKQWSKIWINHSDFFYVFFFCSSIDLISLCNIFLSLSLSLSSVLPLLIIFAFFFLLLGIIRNYEVASTNVDFRSISAK